MPPAEIDDDFKNVDLVEQNSNSSSSDLLLLPRAVDNKTINNSKPDTELLQQEENSVASSGSEAIMITQQPLSCQLQSCQCKCLAGCAGKQKMYYQTCANKCLRPC